jgi:hypothetical protein
MESMGCVKTVKRVWNENSNCYVAERVTDEDSTTRSNLFHSMEEQLSGLAKFWLGGEIVWRKG